MIFYNGFCLSIILCCILGLISAVSLSRIYIHMYIYRTGREGLSLRNRVSDVKLYPARNQDPTVHLRSDIAGRRRSIFGANQSTPISFGRRL